MSEELSSLSVEDTTVLQHVIRSDKRRDRLAREAEILSNALEASNDPLRVVKAFRQVSHERHERKTEEVRRLATRRSGARGWNSRKEQIASEESLRASQERLDADLGAISAEELSEGTQGAANMLADVQASLELMKAPAAEANARIVLRGLGFSEERIEGSMSQLSGGWRTRCRIAASLCQYPDILLMDEPTNFLDLPSIIWLQNYVDSLQHTTVVVVTHDRDFADSVGQELLVLRDLRLEKFKGNLSTYESERHKKQKYMRKMRDAVEKQKKHMESTIQGNIQSARKTGDDKKLKQAASRKKKLEERTGLEVSAKGGRFKLNRDLGGYHLSNRAEIEVDEFDPPVSLKLPSAVADLRFPGALVNMEKVSYAYPRKKVEVLKEIDFTVHPGERIGIAGLNGSGKTTLTSLILPETNNPTKGSVTRHSRARIARFNQEAVENVEKLAAIDPQLTPLTHIMRLSGLDEQKARAMLGGLGLQGRIASEVPLGALSGGQKVRVALAELLWNPPHLLILDEVTTHLDADTILALIVSLRDYEGALLVVTHDRFFMRCVVEAENPYRASDRVQEGDVELEDSGDSDDEDQRAPGRVYRTFRGGLKLLEGGMKQYEEIATRASSKFGKILE